MTMREIKFRGINNDGNWCFGDLIQSNNDHNVWIHAPKINHTYKVAPATVGQFTGLRDSDGREIYEGDVIKLDDEVYAVTWDNYSGCWSVEFGDMGLALLTQYSTKNSTIIGNVHDNPDLLEVEHD